MTLLEQIKYSHSQISLQKPLVLCLTNYVTMDFMANGLLASGAVPLMSESLDELEELLSISQALYLNIGTLNDAFIERALFAAKTARTLGKPVVLDPVGTGASKLRTSTASHLLPFAHVIRGNASEIISLTGIDGATKGVESSQSVNNALYAAQCLGQRLNKVVIISGPEDYVTDGQQQQILPFGSNLMPFITGMGCTMTAILSAFIACNSDYFQASVQATAFFGLCGQSAHQKHKEPGSFRQTFIDNLYNPNWESFQRVMEKNPTKKEYL